MDTLNYKGEMRMKRILLLIPILAMIVGLSGCGESAARSREGLPQSTRLDRNIVAAATARTWAELAMTTPQATTSTGAGTAQGAPTNTTFYQGPDGAIVFHLFNQTDADHPISLGLLRFKEEVEYRSEGELLVEVRYGAGNDGELLEMVNTNQLDAAVITIWSVWQNLTDLANLEALPFIFTNYEEAWAAYEGTLGDWVTRNIVEPNGARALGYWTNGLRHFTNNVRPIYTPADLIGLRMRSPQTTTHLAMYEAFGSASISMPFGQVHGGLSEGTIDGQDNPLGNIHAARLFEVQEYLSLSSHMFSCAPLIVSIDFWYSLSPEHQQILLESSAVAGRYQGELTRAMEVNQLQEMIASGVQVNQIDMPLFIAAVEDIWAEHMERFGNEFATIASRYINDPTALAHRFSN